MKTCDKCKQTLPTEGFYKDRSRKDGLERRCKTCSKAHARKYLPTPAPKRPVSKTATGDYWYWQAFQCVLCRAFACRRTTYWRKPEACTACEQDLRTLRQREYQATLEPARERRRAERAAAREAERAAAEAARIIRAQEAARFPVVERCAQCASFFVQGQPKQRYCAPGCYRKAHRRERKHKTRLATDYTRGELVAESDGACVYCGRVGLVVEKMQVDHITPLSRGGENVRANVLLVCAPCNNDKNDFTLAEWKGEEFEVSVLDRFEHLAPTVPTVPPYRLRLQAAL